ncbi:MAG: hypothetical protein J5545_06710 [Bacteroidaceae bacterium]|nr:hypothetical protein [Bacteroidaceae bacterium]
MSGIERGTWWFRKDVVGQASSTDNNRLNNQIKACLCAVFTGEIVQDELKVVGR